MEVYHILESLESDNSRLEKESILRKNAQNLLLKKIFESAYDPYVNYYVSKFKKPSSIETEENNLNDFFNLLDKLSNRVITGNSAKNSVIELFSRMNKLEQKWCERIILKNLRCGVSDTTINKIWPGTIKSFAVQSMAYTPTIETAKLGLVSTVANGKVVLTGTLTKEGLAGLEVILQYDNTKLTFDNISFDAGAGVTNFSTNGDGRLTFGSMDQTKIGRIKIGTPYKLTFIPKETITNTAGLFYTVLADAVDGSGNKINLTVE